MTTSPISGPMRRLLLLVGAMVFVDTIFFTALTPLLPQYAEELDLSKAGVGVLAAAYPAGALVGGIPGGLSAARFGVKPTVIAGLLLMVVTTTIFGFANGIVLLDLARFVQGFASALTWTAALAWLVSRAPASRRGLLIGTAMSAAIVGALCGPILGAVASVTGTEIAFAAVGAAGLVLAVWAALTPAARPEEPQPLSMLWQAVKERTILGTVWFVALPALLFSTMGVLVSLRLDDLGMSAVGIGIVFLVSAGIEAVLNPLAGRISDVRGRLLPIRFGLAASAVMTAVLPWPESRWMLAAFVILAGMAFGVFWTPAMSHLTDLAERRGLDYAYGFALVNLAWAIRILQHRPFRLLIAVNALNVVDAVMTFLAVRSGGAFEANPVVRYAGLPAKIVLVGLLTWLLYRRKPSALEWPFAALLWVAGYHVAGIVVNGWR